VEKESLTSGPPWAEARQRVEKKLKTYRHEFTTEAAQSGTRDKMGKGKGKSAKIPGLGPGVAKLRNKPFACLVDGKFEVRGRERMWTRAPVGSESGLDWDASLKVRRGRDKSLGRRGVLRTNRRKLTPLRLGVRIQVEH